MNVPWVNGSVEAVLAELRKSVEQNPGCNGMEYAAAVGMIVGLATEEDYSHLPQRPLAERMTHIRTVCQAVRRLQDEL